MHRSIPSLLSRCGGRRVPLLAVTWQCSSAPSIATVGNSASLGLISNKDGVAFGAKRNISSSLPRFGASRELSTALDEEIKAEKELVQDKLGGVSSPSVPGFKITTKGAEVRLSKMHGNEKIEVLLNVNHSVDIEDEEEYEEETSPEMETESVPVALPHFSISITKNNQSLFFALEMVKTEEGGFDFTVEEFFIAPAVNGQAVDEVGDDVYSSSGKYIDPKLHDLLFVRYLEERGFTPEFCQQLVSFATHHEHSQYVTFLDKIKKFVAE